MVRRDARERGRILGLERNIEGGTMRRLYYLADDLETTRLVSEALHAEGIRDWNFHVLARDEAGLYQHSIHAATTYQQLDVIHTGERWAVGGAVIAGIAAAFCYYVQPFPFEVDTLAAVLFTLLGGFFGAWQGGMVGLSRENYKIAPFHDDIDAGRYLIMVDVQKEMRARVRELMNIRFPQVQRAGSSSTIINPLDRPQRVFHQNTH
jgi:hypothetical protein